MGHQTKMPVIGIAAWCQTVEVWGSEMTICQVAEAYVDRVRAAGGLPFIIPHVTDQDVAPIVERIDALILTGGDVSTLLREGTNFPESYSYHALENSRYL